MEKMTYCVWCGSENPADGVKCQKCGKALAAKENLLVSFLMEHTKDKLKGDIEDGIFDALKNFLLSHLYSMIIAVAFVVTAVAALTLPSPGAHIQPVVAAPEAQQVTEPAGYVLTQEDKAEITECMAKFAECMRYTRYVGGDIEYLDYLISEELEESIGYDSYLDMYLDMVEGDIYHYAYCEYGNMTIDEGTWSAEPMTQNSKDLADKGYTIATVYGEYTFYGKKTGMSDAPTELLGMPQYLMTFTIENGKWLLVEQINVSDRLEERQDALL